jgi:DNA-binding MarR family transcriptional regulator
MPEHTFGKFIAAIYRRNQILINKKLENYDIASGQHIFLLIISRNQGISQKLLSEELCIGKATTAKAVKNLLSKGYIYRDVDTKDKRLYHLYLTKKGKEISPIIEKAFREVTEIQTQDFTSKEKEILTNLLNKMLNNLDKEISVSARSHSQQNST